MPARQLLRQSSQRESSQRLPQPSYSREELCYRPLYRFSLCRSSLAFKHPLILQSGSCDFVYIVFCWIFSNFGQKHYVMIRSIIQKFWKFVTTKKEILLSRIFVPLWMEKPIDYISSSLYRRTWDGISGPTFDFGQGPMKVPKYYNRGRWRFVYRLADNRVLKIMKVMAPLDDYAGRFYKRALSDRTDRKDIPEA